MLSYIGLALLKILVFELVTGTACSAGMTARCTQQVNKQKIYAVGILD